MAEHIDIIDADLISLTFKRRDDSVGFTIKGSVTAMPIREASVNDPKEKQLVNEITYSLLQTLSIKLETKAMRQGTLPLEDNGSAQFGGESKATKKSKAKAKPKDKKKKK